MIGSGNNFELMLRDSEYNESITLHVTKGSPESNIDNDMSRFYYTTTTPLTANICGDKYIGFSLGSNDRGIESKYYYRETGHGEYTLSIYTYLKPENYKFLGQLLEKGGNNKVTEKISK
jgi:hypothetical protein